uniref:Uncharacterized protein n=1 Tax=Kalanchoe fedtschenkoi TaxID=63787 RepID=A0A7N0UZZ8_KALFE
MERRNELVMDAPPTSFSFKIGLEVSAPYLAYMLVVPRAKHKLNLGLGSYNLPILVQLFSWRS